MKYPMHRFKTVKTSAFAIVAPLALVAAFSLIGCAPTVRVHINPDGSGSGTFTGALGTASAAVIGRVTGEDSPLSAVDAEEITANLRAAGMIGDAKVSVSDTSLSIDYTVPSLDGLLDRAVTLDIEEKKLSLTLSRESVNEALSLMPTDTRDSLELLMAPVFTGETLSLAEYEDIMAATYGKNLADELRSSVFVLSVECPEPVRSLSIQPPGTAAKTGKTARFSIPLPVLLVMNSPVSLQVTW